MIVKPSVMKHFPMLRSQQIVEGIRALIFEDFKDEVFLSGDALKAPSEITITSCYQENYEIAVNFIIHGLRGHAVYSLVEVYWAAVSSEKSQFWEELA